MLAPAPGGSEKAANLQGLIHPNKAKPRASIEAERRLFARSRKATH
jgi:hypothetical protein